MSKDTFSISELAQKFDISNRTLRYYEEQEIIFPKRVGNKRIYSRQDHGRIRMILRGKRLGFSLEEIKEIIEMYVSGTKQTDQLELFLKIIRQHYERLEIKRRDMDFVLSELRRFEKQCEDLLAKDKVS